MKKPYVELGEKKKIGISIAAGAIIILLFATILFALLYGNAKKNSDVLQNMEGYQLEGSTDTLKVSNLLYQYDGKNYSLSGGKIYYLGKATDIKGYNYKIVLEDISGTKKLVTLMNDNFTGDIAALPEQIDMGSQSGIADAVDFANLADKYRIKVEFQLITATKTVKEEVYLKIIDLNTDFYRDSDSVPAEQ